MRRFHLAFVVLGFLLFAWWAHAPPPPLQYRSLGRYRLSANPAATDLGAIVQAEAAVLEPYVQRGLSPRTPDPVMVLGDSTDPMAQRLLGPFLPGRAPPREEIEPPHGLDRSGKYYVGVLPRSRLQLQLRPVNPEVVLPPAALVVMAGGAVELFAVK